MSWTDARPPSRGTVRESARIAGLEAPSGSRSIVDAWCELTPPEFRWWVGLAFLSKEVLDGGFSSIATALDTSVKTSQRLTITLAHSGYVEIGERAGRQGQRSVRLLREPWWTGIGKHGRVDATREVAKQNRSKKRAPTTPELPGVPVNGRPIFGKRVLE